VRLFYNLIPGLNLTTFKLKLGIDAIKKAGGVCEAVVLYSGDIAHPKKDKYTLKYYLDLVDQRVFKFSGSRIWLAFLNLKLVQCLSRFTFLTKFEVHVG
jgi:pyruvate carboxylase